jgi:hypothetical protein
MIERRRPHGDQNFTGHRGRFGNLHQGKLIDGGKLNGAHDEEITRTKYSKYQASRPS